MAERNHPIRMQRSGDQSSTELSMNSDPIKLTLPMCKTPISPRSSYLMTLLATMAKDIQNKEVNADSILEEHLSRIWQDSDGSMKSNSLHFDAVPNYAINWPKSIKESVTNLRQSSPFFDNRFNTNQYYRQPSYRRCVYPIKKPLGTSQQQAQQQEEEGSTSLNFSMTTPRCDKTEVIRCSWCESDEEQDASRDDIFQIIPGIPPKKHSIILHPNSHHSSLTSSLDRIKAVNPCLVSSSCHSSFEHDSRFKQGRSYPTTQTIRDSPASKPSLGMENLFLDKNNFRDFRSTPPVSVNRSATMETKDSENTEESFTVVGYYLDEDPIPYRTILPCRNPTLGQFKRHLNKKGHLKFFFKKASDEFDSGVVHEEITDDEALLPKWLGKVIGKVEVKQ